MNARIDQLQQLAKGPVWDGNLISKTDRDELVRAGYASRINGWNIITDNGVIVCCNLGLLKA